MSNANNNHKPGDGSSGPKTPSGKLRSSCNSTAHGARSERHIILPNESAADFENLRANWFAEFPPVNDNENDMIERIAETQWRLIRCERLLNEAEAEAFAVDLKPRNWPPEERKYVELMMRYRTAAERAFRAARRDLETLRRNRLEMIHIEEKTKAQLLENERNGMKDPRMAEIVTKKEKPAHVEEEREESPTIEITNGTSGPPENGLPFDRNHRRR